MLAKQHAKIHISRNCAGKTQILAGNLCIDYLKGFDKKTAFIGLTVGFQINLISCHHQLIIDEIGDSLHLAAVPPDVKIA